jgi:pyrimidine deaminase RibD-like protein
MTEERKIELMKLAMEEAKRSKPEDGRVHPFVGAVLARDDGQLLCTAYRGQHPKRHAEYQLLEAARAMNCPIKGSILFVTLEPCTERGPEKIPCAFRIAHSGIKTVFIGTLDPNLAITGHGEIYLSYHLNVERFPTELARELQRLNKDFFELHRDAHQVATSIYTPHADYRPKLVAHRSGLLQQSADLIFGSRGDVWLMGSDLSWYRDLQPTLLAAALEQRSVVMLAAPDDEDATRATYRTAKQAAVAIGASFVEVPPKFKLRGTLVAPHTCEAAMILIERQPKLHGTLYQAPYDDRLMTTILEVLEREQQGGKKFPPRQMKWEQLDDEVLIETLKRNVPQYRDARMERQVVSTDRLVPLSANLERFKLFRVNQIRTIQLRHHLPWALHIVGSPWPITPPVLEQSEDGSLHVIDGTHRAFASLRRGEPQFEALVATGVTAPLPAVPLGSWDEVAVLGEKLPRESRYRNYQDSNFRPIREAFEKLCK